MNTLILNIVFFVILALIIALLLKNIFKYHFLIKDNKNLKLYNNAYYCYYYYAVLFFFLLTMLAVLRNVENGIGGADAQNYIDHFKNKTAVKNWVKKGEFLFAYFTAFIRILTNDYRVYFFVIYSIIVLSYLTFIKTYTLNNISYIPMIALIYLYLISFSVIRTSLAIAIFLFGLSLFKKNKLLGTIVTISTIFIHRASIFAVGVLLFYIIYKKWISKLKWKLQIIIFIALSIIFSFVAFGLQEILISSGFITKVDRNYIEKANERSIINIFNTGLTSLLSFIGIAFCDKYVDKNENYESLKIMNIYCFIFVYPLIVMGVFRFSEYFYIARLLMWGILIASITNNYLKNDKFIKTFKCIVIALFIAFVIYRLYRSASYDDFVFYNFFWN